MQGGRSIRDGCGALLAAGLLLAACSSGDGFTSGPGQTDGGDGSTQRRDAYSWNSDSDAGVIPMPDLVCGGQKMPIQLVHKGDIPDLYLVVDRSGSMILPLDMFQLHLGNKWDAMVRTLGTLVDTYENNIRFGLSLFPSDDACAPGITDQPIKIANAGPIKQSLAIGPDGNTPTHTTVAATRSYLASVPPGQGPRYVLLATDGRPNCNPTVDDEAGPETLAAVNNLAADGIETFVVGFGDIIAADPGLLDQLANAGGKPNPNGPHDFYPATNEAELKAVFFEIAGGIIAPPCTYALQSAPDDPEHVTVTFDGTPVPRSMSNANGWNYSGDGREITFYGQACDDLRAGKVSQVEFIFGCKGPVID